MPRKTSFLFAVTVVGSLLACVRGGGGAVADDAGVDGGSRFDPRYTFSPAAAVRACGRDEDCVILPALSNCSSCCGDGAVARGEAEQAYATINDACRQPGAPMSVTCSMACGANVPICFEGTCVMFPDRDAGPYVDPAAACPNVDAGAGVRDGGAAVPDPLASPSCGARAVQAAFEDALDPSWTATDPAAFQIDRSEPVAGGGSLRIAYRQKDAYLTIAQPDACAVRIAFTLRTRLRTGGLTLARIVAGAGSWFHVRLDGCGLSVAEETRSSEAAGFGPGNVSWPVPAETPMRVVLTVDLRAKTIRSVVAPVGQPFPEPRTSALRGDPSGAGAISAIELGSAPGVQSPAVGVVWLDDLVID